MHRIQIYLDDEIYLYLQNEKHRTRLSFSEIIRNNIKNNIKQKHSHIIKRMEKAAGVWEVNDTTPENYVSHIRKDTNLQLKIMEQQ